MMICRATELRARSSSVRKAARTRANPAAFKVSPRILVLSHRESAHNVNFSSAAYFQRHYMCLPSEQGILRAAVEIEGEWRVPLADHARDLRLDELEATFDEWVTPYSSASYDAYKQKQTKFTVGE
jgi:hypothetical protein